MKIHSASVLCALLVSSVPAWGQVEPSFLTSTPAATLGSWRYDGRIDAADVNGDGLVDIVVTDLHSPDQYPPHLRDFSVLLNHGDGTFAPPTVSIVTRPDSTRANWSQALLALGDVNEDGMADLLTTGGPEPTGFPGNRPNLALLLGSADGHFINQVDLANSTTDLFPMAMRDRAAALADLNGDGHLDIVAPANFGMLAVRLGTGTGTFGPSIASGSATASTVLLVGDVNGDGLPDVVTVIGTGSGSTGASRVDVNLGDGTGRFALSHATGIDGTIFGSRGVQMADFDGDGRADVALRGRAGGERGAGGLYVLRGTAAGQLAPLFRLTQVQHGSDVLDLAAGDFNGDGRAELVELPLPGSTGLVRWFDSEWQVGTQPFTATGAVFTGSSRVADVAGSPLPDIILWDNPGHTESPTGVAFIVNTTRIDEPCRADSDQSGTVDSSDFFGFLATFLDSSPVADFDRSGTVDSTDFFSFLTAFFRGC